MATGLGFWSVLRDRELVRWTTGHSKTTTAFAVDAGLMYVPFSRNAPQSAFTLLPIDFGAYTFTQSAPTQSFNRSALGLRGGGYLGPPARGRGP